MRFGPQRALILTGFLYAVSSVYGSASEESASRTGFYFGAPCTVTLHGNEVESVYREVFALLENLDGQLNVYSEESVVAELNRNAGGRPYQVTDDVYFVVKHGVAYSQLSEGAFDITIGPVVRLWGLAGESPRVPASAELETALEAVDFQKVILLEQGKRIILEDPGMAIDLGGIAIGYAADRAAELITRKGRNHGLLNFGGGVVAIGDRPDGSSWRVAIQHPERTRGNSVGLIEVVDRSVVTTGKYERYFDEGGVRYHHILDTKTGYPVENGVVSVSIITDSSMKADALSTAVFALGPDAGLELINGFEGVEAIVIMENRKVLLTGGVGDSFILIDSGYEVVK